MRLFSHISRSKVSSTIQVYEYSKSWWADLALKLLGWIRTIFAEGPRQLINALTLYSVMEADIIPHGVKKGEELSAFFKFFENFAAFGKQDRVVAVVLGSMLFTLIIWVFAMLQLLIAGLLYIIYLCHVIGSESGLYGYCKVRVDEKLGKIVATNHKKELERQQKTDTPKPGGLRKGPGSTKPTLARQPTLPISLLDGNVGPNVSIVSRPTDTNGNRVPTLPNVALPERPVRTAVSMDSQSRMGSTRSNQPLPHPPSRSATTSTTDSRITLLNDQAGMGYGGRGAESHHSSTAGSIYTQRSGFDGYEYPESPLSTIVPTTGVPTSAPSRQQIRPPPPTTQPGNGYYRGLRNGVGYQQYSRQVPPRGDHFSEHENQNSYNHPERYNGYNYNRQAENMMWSAGSLYNDQRMISHRGPPPPLRVQSQNSQGQRERYNFTGAASAPPLQSTYPPPPPVPRSSTTVDPHGCYSQSGPSQDPETSLNDFDFGLENKDESIYPKLAEIEMAPQPPTSTSVCGVGQEQNENPDGEWSAQERFSGSCGVDTLKSTSASSTVTANPPQRQSMATQQQYVAYNPSLHTISPPPPQRITSLGPPKRATTLGTETTRAPIDYFNTAATPRRVGTAPPAAQQQSILPAVDYFGARRTPARVGTALSERDLTSTSMLQEEEQSAEAYREWQQPSGPVKRTKTAPVGSVHEAPRPREFGDEAGDRA